MTCDNLTLFDMEEASSGDDDIKARRNPPRVPAKRGKPQLHLPVFEGEEAEVAGLEAFAEEHRPLTRGECEEEARPCPWVSCRWHLYNGRFEEFAALIEMIPDTEHEDFVEGALAHVFGPGPVATEVVGKRGPAERVPADAIVMSQVKPQSEKEPEVTGRWPTCALDVADDVRGWRGKALGQTAVAALSGVTREAIRQMQHQAALFYASDPAMRDFLLDGLTTTEKVLAAAMRKTDKYGEGG